jgi:hypothetical protein
MGVNKYTFLQNGLRPIKFNIPIESSWDFEGLDDAVDQYEETAIKEVLGLPYDFEVNRFSHEQYNGGETKINYDFCFYSGGSLSDSNSWQNSYLGEGFTVQDVFYYSNKFTKSFFKLDFYDSVDDKKQKNYFTVIIPTQQGYKMTMNMGYDEVEINKPKYSLDYVGDKEGFFLYWLKDLEFTPITTFYMTAKFYNAGTGQFTKMMNVPQSSIIGNKYDFDALKYFYYKVVLDYKNITYSVYDNTDQRIGTTSSILWYEYVNPPQ